jgi:hypothetical protein
MATPDLSKKVDSLSTNVNVMQTDLLQMKNQVKEIHHALIGNDLGQEGLVSRVKKLEDAKKKYEQKLNWGAGYIFGFSSLAVGIIEVIKYFLSK